VGLKPPQKDESDMKRRTKIVFGMVALAGISGTAFVVSTAGGSEDGSEQTVEVKRGEIVDKALAVGRIEPLVEVSVKSQLAGVVRRLFKEPGEHVRRGEPLLEIQPNPTPIELVEARRQMELRELELAQLQKKRDRLEALREQDYVSQEEFETVDRSYNEARLQFQIARERLALLQEGRVTIGTESVETVIKAPITGFILEKTVEIGDPVVPLTTFQEGTVLMSMAEMDELIFRGTVDEIDVGRLSEGMPVELKIGALPDAVVQGRLSRISLKGQDEENATIFPVEITVLPSEDAVLRAGYSANADIIIERHEDVLYIPERLVRFEEDAATVTVRLTGEQTEERSIETGLSDGINIEVLAGLEEGERVVEPPPREIS
jgi:HlyD family secretion protein